MTRFYHPFLSSYTAFQRHNAVAGPIRVIHANGWPGFAGSFAAGSTSGAALMRISAQGTVRRLSAQLGFEQNQRLVHSVDDGIEPGRTASIEERDPVDHPLRDSSRKVDSICWCVAQTPYGTIKGNRH
jgi:hypothetical protein